MLNFITYFFCIYWDDHVVFVLSYVDVYHINFAFVEPSLWRWGESDLIMVYDFFVLLDLANVLLSGFELITKFVYLARPRLSCGLQDLHCSTRTPQLWPTGSGAPAPCWHHTGSGAPAPSWHHTGSGAPAPCWRHMGSGVPAPCWRHTGSGAPAACWRHMGSGHAALAWGKWASVIVAHDWVALGNVGSEFYHLGLNPSHLDGKVDS